MTTWDSKLTTVISILGGFAEEVSWGLKDDGVLDEFYDKINTEWGAKFTIIEGLDIEYAYPRTQVNSGRPDFTTCQSNQNNTDDDLFLF